MLDDSWSGICVKFQVSYFQNVHAILGKLAKKFSLLKRGHNSCKNQKIENPRLRPFLYSQGDCR